RLDLISLETALVDPTDGTAPAQAEVMLEQPGRPVVRKLQTADGATIEVESGDGPVICTDIACKARISSVAWRPGTDELAFTSRDEHFRQTLHLWDVRGGTVRTVARADGLIAGSRSPGRPCAMTGEAAVCVAAGAVSPPRLERIDLVSGERRVLFDPNPV